MSFKRDGDDLSVLNILKHKRVSDLLGSHIPEDEAKLLSNGRLTCTVCSFRPIFDTVAMLAKHRKGKKHILELSRYLKRKVELEMEILRRQELNSVQFEMSIQPIIPIPSRLLGHGGRDGVYSEAKRKKTIELPAFNISEPPLPVSPDTPSPRSSASNVRRYLKTLHRKRSLESLVEYRRENFNKIKKVEAPAGEERPFPESMEALKENIDKSSPSLSSKTEFSLNLSGWIKDKNGEWVKDPNAEFDSDEESPPKA